MTQPPHSIPIAARREASPASKIVVTLLLFLTVAVGFLIVEMIARRRPNAPSIRHVTPRADLRSDEQATIEIFQNSSAAVVHITTLGGHIFSSDMTTREGTGSGFVWDELGHVVTNYHVVEDATKFLITFADQKTIHADLVGIAPHKDLAVLRVNVPTRSLSPIVVGASYNLQVGQSVLAIGNPFGLDQTLTTGVISGLGREIRSTTERPISDVIQTDAAINPGNSGGPLLDSAGRLIGVNTAIASANGTSGGVGFAIPVDTVRRVIPQLIRHQRVITPALGIVPVNPNMTKRVGLDGVLVKFVQDNGPAAKAGMMPFRYDATGQLIYGDLIVAINDNPIREMDDLYQILEAASVGQTVKINVVRSANTNSADSVELKVTLGSDH